MTADVVYDYQIGMGLDERLKASLALCGVVKGVCASGESRCRRRSLQDEAAPCTAPTSNRIQMLSSSSCGSARTGVGFRTRGGADVEARDRGGRASARRGGAERPRRVIIAARRQTAEGFSRHAEHRGRLGLRR